MVLGGIPISLILGIAHSKHLYWPCSSIFYIVNSCVLLYKGTGPYINLFEYFKILVTFFDPSKVPKIISLWVCSFHQSWNPGNFCSNILSQIM